MTIRSALALVALLFASVAQAAGVPPAGCIGKTWTQMWSRIDTDLDPVTLQTTAVYFTVQAPCYVTFDTDFVVTTRIVDERCAVGDIVGNRWNVTDTDLSTGFVTTIAGAGVNGVTGFASMRLGSGVPDPTWVSTVKQHYGPTGSAVNHRIGFRFIPRGDSGCTVTAMNWNPALIGTTTYDPYADSSVVDPAPPASTDPAPPASTDPGTGTSTGGSGGGVDGGGTGTGGTPGAPAVPGTPTSVTSADSGGCGSSGVTPALLGIAALAAAGLPRRRRAR